MPGMEFRGVVHKNHIDLPTHISKDRTEGQITKMAETSYALSHMWDHALGSRLERKVNACYDQEIIQKDVKQEIGT